jgi:murein DD-endopeptidase MepM/ murein hydrolase activator NlpD
MATRTSAGGACSETLPAIGQPCRATPRERVLRALFCVVLGLCAGCSSSADQAKAMPGTGPAPLPPREPVSLAAKTLLVKPVDRGRLTSVYGTRYNPFSKRRQRHQGIDWAAPRGTPVRAAGDGVVVAAGRLSSYGRYLRIDHGGTVETAYAHLDRYASKLRPGRIVRQGDEVGRVGSSGRATGPHLHYEVLVAGRQIDALALPTVTAAPAQDPSGAASGVADSEFGIGGPDIAVEEEAGDAALRDDGIAALPLEAIDGSTVIRVDDLLHRHAPLEAPGRPSHSTDSASRP